MTVTNGMELTCNFESDVIALQSLLISCGCYDSSIFLGVRLLRSYRSSFFMLRTVRDTVI